LETYFAVAAPGLEPILLQELQALGLSAQAEAGGVSFRSDLAGLYRANLQLLTASRILARLGNFFYATSFEQLEARAARLPWERFLSPGRPVELRVTCHRSRLYHSGAVAGSISKAIAARLGRPSPAGQDPQLVVVRLAENRCTISIDSSGELLHRRGYRQAVARAPLRETLAAALLLSSGWDLASPLLDPFCGSGTIPIEAARMALGIPPGSGRRFAFMDWPGYEPLRWSALLAEARPHPAAAGLVIQASDRDAGAVRMAGENAERGGVAGAIEFSCRAISAITPPAGPGWIVTNPPYGTRLSGGGDLRDLYARLGQVLRRCCPGWGALILCSDPALLGQTRLGLETGLALRNGGIRVYVGRGRVG
jgi:putative N6-adenine-specific DNA methylase